MSRLCDGDMTMLAASDEHLAQLLAASDLGAVSSQTSVKVNTRPAYLLDAGAFSTLQWTRYSSTCFYNCVVASLRLSGEFVANQPWQLIPAKMRAVVVNLIMINNLWITRGEHHKSKFGRVMSTGGAEPFDDHPETADEIAMTSYLLGVRIVVREPIGEPQVYNPPGKQFTHTVNVWIEEGHCKLIVKTAQLGSLSNIVTENFAREGYETDKILFSRLV